MFGIERTFIGPKGKGTVRQMRQVQAKIKNNLLDSAFYGTASGGLIGAMSGAEQGVACGGVLAGINALCTGILGSLKKGISLTPEYCAIVKRAKSIDKLKTK